MLWALGFGFKFQV